MSHLVVHPQRELLVGVGHVCGVSEAVDRQTTCQDVRDSGFLALWVELQTNWWQEDLDVTSSDQLGVC